MPTETSAPKRLRWHRRKYKWFRELNNWKKTLFSLSTVYILIVAVNLFSAWRDNRYKIKSFDVPESFSKDGMSGRSVALAISDKVRIIIKESATPPRQGIISFSAHQLSISGGKFKLDFKPARVVSKQGIAAYDNGPEGLSLPVKIAGAEFSTEQLTDWLVNLLLPSRHRVDGEVVRIGQWLALTIRINDEPYVLKEPIQGNNLLQPLDLLLDKASTMVIREYDPLSLATWYFNKHKIDDCIAVFNQDYERIFNSDKSKRNVNLAYNLWAAALYEKKDFLYASRILEIAREYDQKFTMTHIMLGNVNMALGNKKEAAANYTAAEIRAQKQPEGLVDLGNAFYNNTQYDSAVKVYGQVKPDHPSYYEALCGIGLCQMVNHNFAQAASTFLEALKHKPNYANGLFYLAEVYTLQEKYLESLDILNGAPVLDSSTNLNATYLIAFNYNAMARSDSKYSEYFTKAKDICSGIIARNADYIPAYNLQGLIYNNSLNKHYAAIASYLTVLRKDPGNAEAFKNYGNALSDSVTTGKESETIPQKVKVSVLNTAAGLFKTSIDIRKDAETYNDLAYTYEYLGEYDSSMRYADSSLKYSVNANDSAYAYSTIAEDYAHKGDKTGFYTYFDKMLSKHFKEFDYTSDEPYKNFVKDDTFMGVIKKYHWTIRTQRLASK